MSVELNGCLKVEVNSGVGLLCLHLPYLFKIWDVNVRCQRQGKFSNRGGGRGVNAGLKYFLL